MYQTALAVQLIEHRHGKLEVRIQFRATHFPPRLLQINGIFDLTTIPFSIELKLHFIFLLC